MIYTVTFNPALDYVVRMDSLIPGEVNRTAQEEIFFGGKGINVSTVLNELGEESVALGFIAGFTGDALAAGVGHLGVQTDFIKLPAGNTRINVKIKAAKETEINAGGPPIPKEAFEALVQKLDRLKEGDVLCLSGSIPKSLEQNTYEVLLEHLSGRGIRFVVDATGDLLLNVLKYHPFLIKPNHHELGEMLGKTLANDREIEDGARELQKRGARNVLVSMAGDGAMLLTETGDSHRIGVVDGTVRNSVGAGDSMVAGFIAGYLQKQDYLYALQLGSACGSATAFSDGLCKKETIYALLAQLQ